MKYVICLILAGLPTGIWKWKAFLPKISIFFKIKKSDQRKLLLSFFSKKGVFDEKL
jgi:hypothetical protein